MATQWRAGMGGATGLDYAALPSVMQMVGIPRKKWPELFEDIRTMEAAALNHMHKKKS